MMNIENYKKKLESMSREELLHEISNLISDHGIQLQNKNIELQELESALARADLQLQFQIGEVDLRDKEIESLKGKRKPEYNEVLNILNNFSEVAYKQGCAKDILKVIGYMNWQSAEIERLTEELEEKNTYEEKLNSMIDNLRDDISEQKAEIERLTEWKDKLQDTKDELEQQLIDTGFKEYCEENKRLTDENAELQKQVDWLKLDLENWKKAAYGYKYTEEQAVKDKAKEIISLLEDMDKRGMTVPFDMVLRQLKKHCGVEVE